RAAGGSGEAQRTIRRRSGKLVLRMVPCFMPGSPSIDHEDCVDLRSARASRYSKGATVAPWKFPGDQPMRKLIVHEFITLDGVIQAPGGEDEDQDGGFAHGGWTRAHWHDDIGMSFGALMKDVDAFLLGRRTYVTHANA